MLYANPLLHENIPSDMKYIWKKYLTAGDSSGSNEWARVKRERRYSRKRLLRIRFFDSGLLHNENERPDMKRKCMNTDKALWKIPS